MKRILFSSAIRGAVGTVLALCTSSALAQTDTTFSYQGRLDEQGAPANGAFNLEIALFDLLNGGTPVAPVITLVDHPVADGLFSAELDFGAAAFDNSNRWLEISVNGTVLSPRQPVNRAPQAIQTRGLIVDDINDVGIGTLFPAYPLHVSSDRATSILVSNNSTEGLGIGGSFQTSNPTGVGVSALAFGDDGVSSGVLGGSNSSNGRGVSGVGSSTTGTNFGVHGTSSSNSGTGVYGLANSPSGITFGARFYSDSTSGRGVFGYTSAGTGFTYGGQFRSVSTSGHGVFGYCSARTGTNYGGWLQSDSTGGIATYGFASSLTGITYGGWFRAHSTSGRGVFGIADANSGVNYGVVGHSNSSSGYDFWASGAGTNYGSPSSRRWKSNVEPIGDPLGKLSKLRGVYFDWDEEHGGAHDVGMIAEEVGGVMPEIVNYEENGVDAIGMDYSKMAPLLVEAINALRAEKNEQIQQLRYENRRLAARIDHLEQMMAIRIDN